MERTTRRRIGALAASATLLASLTLVAVAATTSAAPPRCGGQDATIVGIDEDEVIVGTAGADVIAARGGDDIIRGLGGQDIICGDGGSDRIYGQAGKDKLFGKTDGDKLYGGAGADLLAGQAGGDRLDGGLGTDTCYQAGGSGLLLSCELPSAAPTPTPAPAPTPTPGADLHVEVVGPVRLDSQYPLVYDVTVTNQGPAATAYQLSGAIDYPRTWDPRRECAPVATPGGQKPGLSAGESTRFTYEYGCNGLALDARLTVSVAPLGGAIDPDPSDDSDSWVTEVR